MKRKIILASDGKERSRVAQRFLKEHGIEFTISNETADPYPLPGIRVGHSSVYWYDWQGRDGLFFGALAAISGKESDEVREWFREHSINC